MRARIRKFCIIKQAGMFSFVNEKPPTFDSDDESDDSTDPNLVKESSFIIDNDDVSLKIYTHKTNKLVRNNYIAKLQNMKILKT